MKTLLSIGLISGVLAIVPLAVADERPPQDGKTLLEVVTSLEESAYGPIVEISFDDGVWEVETYKDDVAFELSIDPKSGEVISEHRDDGDPKPPADSLKLSEIVGAVEKAGFTNLSDISFEGRSWEVEAEREGQKRELRVDAKDGRVISDRVDD